MSRWSIVLLWCIAEIWEWWDVETKMLAVTIRNVIVHIGLIALWTVLAMLMLVWFSTILFYRCAAVVVGVTTLIVWELLLIILWKRFRWGDRTLKTSLEILSSVESIIVPSSIFDTWASSTVTILSIISRLFRKKNDTLNGYRIWFKSMHKWTHWLQ